jgi:hypothetical protein
MIGEIGVYAHNRLLQWPFYISSGGCGDAGHNQLGAMMPPLILHAGLKEEEMD